MALSCQSLDAFRSPSDAKSYRVVTLPNGLEALLVQHIDATGAATVATPRSRSSSRASFSRRRTLSRVRTDDDSDAESEDESEPEDEEATRTRHSAACLTVGVGSMADPADLQGLAHFLEHMLFMGSEKYPDENEFEAFLSTHGGYSNGATECETTRFVFEIGPEHLSHALDIFAQFFIAPLLRREAMARELQAVESEFNRAMQNDYVRLQQVQCDTCADGHPYRAFGWGNAESLQRIPEAQGVDVRERMVQFYEKHYSAHVMKLCVYGEDSLDDMQRWVEHSFSKIPRRSVGEPSKTESAVARPFGQAAGQKPTLVKILPIRKLHSMHIYWTLPPLLHAYRQKPWEYMAHVLGHECAGSITAILSDHRWATHVSAGITESDGFEFGSFGALFEVQISLTKDGLAHWDEVAQVVFDVVHFVRAEGFQPWIFDELRASSELAFRFQEESEPLALCRQLSGLMQDRYCIQRPDLLRYETIQGVFDEAQTQAVLDEMTPENTRILLLSHSFENEPNMLSERWFGAQYATEPIPQRFLESWASRSPGRSISQPSRNRFMPQQFEILPMEQKLEPGAVPELVHTTDMSKLWFKQDDTFFTPKMNANFFVSLPSIKQSVDHYIYAKIFVKMVNDALKHVLYQANIANLEFEIGIRDMELEVTFSGFNETLPELVRVVFQTLLASCSQQALSRGVFTLMRDEMIKEYRNLNLKTSVKARYMRLLLLERLSFPIDDKLRVLEHVTYEQLVDFASCELWNCAVTIKSLVHGNVWCQQAIDLVAGVESEIVSMTMLLLPPISPRALHTTELPVTTNGILLRDMSEHDEETNSTIEVYYQLGQCSDLDHAYAELLDQIMSEPLFYQLRTCQQLGYEVYCCVRETYGVLGFSVSVQSASHASGEIALCIDAFIHETFLELLGSLPEEQFANHVATLQRLKSRPDTNLTDETDRYWEEIQIRRYAFTREQELVKALGECSLAGLLQRYRTWMVDEQGSRKLRIHVIGKSSNYVPLEELVGEDDAPEIIDNLREYKEMLTCHC